MHTVCTRVTAEFLAFSASVGNDLSTPHPEFGFAGLQPGDQWCLCAPRWQEAFEAGDGPAGRPGLDPRRHARVGAAERPGRPRRLAISASVDAGPPEPGQPGPDTKAEVAPWSAMQTGPSSASNGSSRPRPARSSPSSPTPRATPRSTARAPWSRPRPARRSGSSLGSTFGMSMKLGVPYSMTNTVIEFEPDRRIAWQTVLAGPARPLHRRAHLALRARGAAPAAPRSPRPGTSPEDKQALPPQAREGGQADRGQHDQDARAPGRAHRVVTVEPTP